MSESRRSFGERKVAYVRLPDDHHDFYDAVAAQEGLDLGPWIVKELAKNKGLPVPEHVGRIKRRKRSLDNDLDHDHADRRERADPAA